MMKSKSLKKFYEIMKKLGVSSYLWKSHNNVESVIGDSNVVMSIALLARATLTW